MRTFLISVRPRSHVRAASARERLRHRAGMCNRTRPGMKWRMLNSTAGPSSAGRPVRALHDHGRDGWCFGLRRVHLDHVIEGKQRECDPNWRSGRGAHLEHGYANDAEREHNLEVYVVARGEPDFAVGRLESIHDGARGLGMLCQELHLLLDLVG